MIIIKFFLFLIFIFFLQKQLTLRHRIANNHLYCSLKRPRTFQKWKILVPRDGDSFSQRPHAQNVQQVPHHRTSLIHGLMILLCCHRKSLNCRKGCSWLKKLIVDLKNSIVYVLGKASVNAVIISDASLCSAKHDTKEKNTTLMQHQQNQYNSCNKKKRFRQQLPLA